MSHPRSQRFRSIRSFTASGLSLLLSRKKVERALRSAVPALNVWLWPPPRQHRKCLAALRFVAGRGLLLGYERVLNETSGRSLLRACRFSIIEFSKSAGLVFNE